jgi:hypothetical protein
VPMAVRLACAERRNGKSNPENAAKVFIRLLNLKNTGGWFQLVPGAGTHQGFHPSSAAKLHKDSERKIRRL